MISASTKEIIDFSFNSFKLMEAHSRLPIRLIFFNASKNRLDAATFGGTLNYKHDEPTSFFFTLSISFFLVAHALPCGKLVGLFPCASKGIIHQLCLRQLVLNKTKRMTGKSLCEMRGWV